MRIAKVLLVTLLLALGVVAWLLYGSDPAGTTLALGTAGREQGSRQEVVAPGATEAAAGEVPSERHRVEAEPVRAESNACLLVVERTSGRALAGAEVRRYRGSMEPVTTEADGTAALRLDGAEQLVVALDGYLLRLCAARPGTTAAAPQRVALEPDTFSLRCRFRLMREDGAPVEPVLVCMRPVRPEHGAQLPEALRRGPEQAQHAFREHSTIAVLQPFPGRHFQLGEFNQALTFELAAEATVLFTWGGLFELEARTRDGLAARVVFQAERTVEEPLHVRLLPGKYLECVVMAENGGGVAGAKVVVQGVDPLGLRAESDAAGCFRIGPFADGPVMLALTHPDMQPTTFGPLTAGLQGGYLQIRMVRLQKTTLQGAVRARGGLQPVRGATVSVVNDAGQVSSAETDERGSFSLRTAVAGPLRLSVTAKGMVTLREMVEAQGQYLWFDLWPDDAAVRVRERLTGVLAGIAVDEHGAPVAGRAIRWVPDQEKLAVVPGGRRILEGAVPLLPAAVTAGDGSFQVESWQEGPGSLVPSQQEAGLRAALDLGQTRTGLRVQVTR